MTPVVVAATRARRRPGRWVLPALGITLATAFACAVLGEAKVVGDRAAHRVLATLAPLDRTVRVTWSGGATPLVDRRATTLLAALAPGAQTRVIQLNGVRVGTTVVQLAGIAPLRRWVALARGRLPARACMGGGCPVLAASGPLPRGTAMPGARLRVVGAGRLLSSVPLGFVPPAGTPPAAAGADAQPPLLLSGDVGGVEALPALTSVYRTHSWLAPLPVERIASWDLPAVTRRLQRANAELLMHSDAFTLAAPFAGLAAAQDRADAAPRRLLLVGGGALAALAAFLVLAASAMRLDAAAELQRLRNAGARRSQRLMFAIAESAWPSAIGVLAGFALGVGVTALLARASGSPVRGVLTHSLLAPAGLLLAVASLLVATAALAALLSNADAGVSGRARHAADALALAAAAGLALALARGGDAGSVGDPLPLLLAPLGCVVAGVVLVRIAVPALQAIERVARGGPVAVRLALVGVARTPRPASLAIAFLAVSTGLGGFALAYRATLTREAADQAADRVPLDVTVAPGTSLVTPLSLASIERWRAIAGGTVLPVRRTESSVPRGATFATLPTLGVPAGGLALLHGWRDGDASAPRALLARSLVPPTPARTPGPTLPAGTRTLALVARSLGDGVEVAAVLRSAGGDVSVVSLGEAGSRPRALRAALPAGRWELQALELQEPTGVLLTAGHQNAENPGANTQLLARMRIGRALALDGAGRALAAFSLAGWTARGAAEGAHAIGSELGARFTSFGSAGVLRPVQPGDSRPLSVLVDPATAAGAAPGGRLPLMIDGVPIVARVVGVLRRFPTLPGELAGFVVADEAALDDALGADAPGQGRTDELWLTTPRPAATRAALRDPALAALSTSFRSDIERSLRSDPVVEGVLGTLLAAAALSLTLAVIGLLVTLFGTGRDRALERDLYQQGVGPRALRADLRLRTMLVALCGVVAGLALSLGLTRLVVAAVRDAAGLVVPRLPVVAVVPWSALAAWGLLVLASLLVAAWLASVALGRRAAP